MKRLRPETKYSSYQRPWPFQLQQSLLAQAEERQAEHQKVLEESILKSRAIEEKAEKIKRVCPLYLLWE